MDAELKAKWIAALRGGEYTQTRGCIRSDDEDGTSFCCLGVLCDVDKSLNYNGECYVDSNGNGVAFGWLTKDYSDRIGLGNSMHFADLNDVDELSFTEIADAIEKEV